LAEKGFLDPLFVMLNRSGASEVLIAWVDDRWPTLADFIADCQGDGIGHPLMAELAYAYLRTGDAARAAEALACVDDVRKSLTEQGIDNILFMVENSQYFALTGNHDAAFEWLGRAVDRGLQVYAPLSKWIPALDLLEGNPRFAEIEATMIRNINEDRVAIGLQPIDPYTEFWQ
jgi:hypothetical protein